MLKSGAKFRPVKLAMQVRLALHRVGARSEAIELTALLRARAAHNKKNCTSDQRDAAHDDADYAVIH
jgi:hypothetical protein